MSQSWLEFGKVMFLPLHALIHCTLQAHRFDTYLATIFGEYLNMFYKVLLFKYVMKIIHVALSIYYGNLKIYFKHTLHKSLIVFIWITTISIYKQTYFYENSLLRICKDFFYIIMLHYWSYIGLFNNGS